MTPRGDGPVGNEQDLIGTLLMDEDDVFGNGPLNAYKAIGIPSGMGDYMQRSQD
jgi:hypothetical protein